MKSFIGFIIKKLKNNLFVESVKTTEIFMKDLSLI